MKFLKQMPVSILAVVILWTLRAMYGFDTAWLRDTLGFGLDGQTPLWTVLSSALTVGTWAGATLSTLALLTIGGAVERKLGSLTFLVTAAWTHVVGLLCGTLIATGLESIGLYWGETLEAERVLNPFVWLCGTAMYASAFMGPLRRHRLRVIFFTLTITLILYAGVLADFAFFSACLAGWAVGQWRTRLALKRFVASIRESRVLVAIVFAVVFFGPLAAGMNPDSTGPFSDSIFFVEPRLSSEHVAMLCERRPQGHRCQNAVEQLRVAGIGPMIGNIIQLAVVVAMSLGLIRGRRLALRFALLWIFCTVVAIAYEMKSVGLFDALLITYVSLPWILCAALLLMRRDLFQVKLAPERRRKFYGAVFVWWLITAAGWIVGAWWVMPSPLIDVLRATPLRYLPPAVAKFASFDVLPLSKAAWVLTEWTGIIFWLGFLILFLRALVRPADPCAAQSRDRARNMLQQGSGDHLSWMTLWPRNNYWFGEGGYVAYRLESGIAVTVGEPVSSGAPVAQLADAFERDIYAQGAQVAWYSVRPEFAATRPDWHTVLVAEESVVKVGEEPAFKGKKFQDIRTARNHATKQGIHTEWTTWQACSLPQRAQIAAISEAWVSDKALPEMGFTLGGLAELDDPEVRLMIAVGEDGIIHGVTSWLPCYVDGKVDGLVLDFMRRRTDGFRPVVEYLIAAVLVQAHNDGLNWVSLSGAPLAVAGTGPLGAILDRVGHALEPLYGFRSLAAFKRKFNPEHQQWLMLYRDELALPAIGMAVSKSYLPDTSVGELMGAMRGIG